MRLLTCLVVVVLVGCGGIAARPPSLPPGAHTGEPRTPEEKRVAKFILEHADEPSSVKWLIWGPNDTSGLTHYKDPARFKIVRVRFQTKPKEGPVTTLDSLIGLNDYPGRVPVTGGPNLQGNDWLRQLQASKAARDKAALEGP